MILYISSISVAYSVTNLCSLLDLCQNLPSEDYLMIILFFKKMTQKYMLLVFIIYNMCFIYFFPLNSHN